MQNEDNFVNALYESLKKMRETLHRYEVRHGITSAWALQLSDNGKLVETNETADWLNTYRTYLEMVKTYGDGVEQSIPSPKSPNTP